jgi:hypothetical protein
VDAMNSVVSAIEQSVCNSKRSRSQTSQDRYVAVCRQIAGDGAARAKASRDANRGSLKSKGRKAPNWRRAQAICAAK